jgi:hypothetical protein
MSRTARAPAAERAPERPVEFRMLPVDQVDESPRNPRRSFDEAAMQELTESVRTHGVIEPIVVRPVDEGFEVVAGARRLRACRAAERAEIPALVQEMTEAEVKAELAAAAKAGKVMKCAPTAAPKRGTCFICGCTEAAACPGGCAWVDETELICSAHPEDAIAFARKELAKPASGKKRGRAR